MEGNGGAAAKRLAHQAILYSSDEDLLAAAVPFLNAGLDWGEKILVITGEATTSLLQEALGRHADLMEFVDPSEWQRVPAWTMAAFDRSISYHVQKGLRVRVFGEPMWAGRSRLEITEWARLESLLNVAFSEVPVSLLCSYDVGRLDPDIVAAARQTHPQLVTAEETRSSPDYIDPAVYSAHCDRKELPEPTSTVIEHLLAPDNLPYIRELAFREGRRMGLTPGRAEDLTIAVSELAANAIRHGGGSGRLKLWGQGHWVVGEVTDEAGTIDTPFAGHLPPTDPTQGGRGLWMCRQLCELVQIRCQPGGCTVRLLVRT